jgi:hypothetical protein
MSKEQEFLKLHNKIISLSPLFIQGVQEAIIKRSGNKKLDDYKIVWNQLQNKYPLYLL